MADSEGLFGSIKYGQTVFGSEPTKSGTFLFGNSRYGTELYGSEVACGSAEASEISIETSDTSPANDTLSRITSYNIEWEQGILDNVTVDNHSLRITQDVTGERISPVITLDSIKSAPSTKIEWESRENYLYFNGTDTIVNLNDYKSVDTSLPFKYEIEFLTKTTIVSQILLGQEIYGSDVAPYIYISGGNIMCTTINNLAPYEVLYPIIEDYYYKVVVEYDGNDLILYLNNNEVDRFANIPTIYNDDTNDLYIGEEFHGYIYNLKIYNDTDNLVTDLPMDEGSGSQAYDDSGLGNNGSISNGEWRNTSVEIFCLVVDNDTSPPMPRLYEERQLLTLGEGNDGTFNLATYYSPLYYNLGSEPFSWVAGYAEGSRSSSKLSTSLYLRANFSNPGGKVTWVTDVAVDLTDVRYLKIDWLGTRHHAQNQGRWSFIASTSKTGNYATYNARLLRTTNFTRRTESLDVRSLTGKYYLRVNVTNLLNGQPADGTGIGDIAYTSNVYKVWSDDSDVKWHTGNFNYNTVTDSSMQTALRDIYLLTYSSAVVSNILVEDLETDDRRYYIKFLEGFAKYHDTNLFLQNENLTNPEDSSLEVVQEYPSPWITAVNGGSIPGITPYEDYTGKYLWTEQVLTSNHDDISPQLYELSELMESFPPEHLQVDTLIEVDNIDNSIMVENNESDFIIETKVSDIIVINEILNIDVPINIEVSPPYKEYLHIKHISITDINDTSVSQSRLNSEFVVQTEINDFISYDEFLDIPVMVQTGISPPYNEYLGVKCFVNAEISTAQNKFEDLDVLVKAETGIKDFLIMDEYLDINTIIQTDIYDDVEPLDDYEDVVYDSVSGFIGTKFGRMGSISGRELLPEKPENWTMDVCLDKFVLEIDSATTVRINNSLDIYLRAGSYTFEYQLMNDKITSAKIMSYNTMFRWYGQIANKKR